MVGTPTGSGEDGAGRGRYEELGRLTSMRGDTGPDDGDPGFMGGRIEPTPEGRADLGGDVGWMAPVAGDRPIWAAVAAASFSTAARDTESERRAGGCWRLAVSEAEACSEAGP